mmetsp:Transcript_29014/g.56023  ORF Transcript_29014/g.56023 Transcript_29014/m.56023 type:complete len:264 (-) Transcript_29014:18-809(-)
MRAVANDDDTDDRRLAWPESGEALDVLPQASAAASTRGQAPQSTQAAVIKGTDLRLPILPLFLSLTAFAIWVIILGVSLSPSTPYGLSVKTVVSEGLLFHLFLGLLISLQGLGKMVHVTGYLQALNSFKVPVPSWTVGVFFIVVEFFSGPAMIMGSLAADYSAFLTLSAFGAILDIAGYVILSLWAYLRGRAYSWKFKCVREDGKCVQNCTSFGVYGAQKLSIWVLVQDVLVVAETTLVAARVFSHSVLFMDPYQFEDRSPPV